MAVLARKLMDAPAVAGAVTRDGVTLNGREVLYKAWSGKTATDGKKYTFSLWFETSSLADFSYLGNFGADEDGQLQVYYNADGSIVVDASSSSGTRNLVSASSTIATNTKYFLMVVFDSTQGTASNRVKVWFGPYAGTVSQASWTGSGTISLNATFRQGDGSADSFVGAGLATTAETISGAIGKMADVYWLDGVALSDPSSIVDSYASNAKPTAYSGAYGNTGWHLDFSTAGSLGSDTSGNGNNFTLPQVAVLGSVLSVPTTIGNGTAGGGLAAAFDGTTNQAIAASAQLAGNNAIYVGADFGSGTEKRVYKAEIWGTNDQGYVSGANPSVTLTLRSGTTAPAGATSGTSRGTATFTDTANESGNTRTINSSDKTTAIRYWHVATGTHNATKGIAEIKFYESLIGQITSSNQVTSYL